MAYLLTMHQRPQVHIFSQMEISADYANLQAVHLSNKRTV